jgi:hypothetical protein
MARSSRVLTMSALGLLVLSTTASADLTVTSRTAGKGLGMAAEGESVMHLKGLRMRTDTTIGGTKISTIVDLEAAQFVSLNHEDRRAEVHDMRKAAADLEKVADSDVKVTLTPTSQTRQILGRPCVEHRMEVVAAFAPAGADKVTVTMRGPVWIAADSPGAQDWRRFYTAAADKGLFFTDPRAVRVDPARTRGMTSLYRRMADLGVAYSTHIDISFQGSGTMAGLMSKIGGSSMTSEVIAISTEPASDEIFAIPAGYETLKK